MTHLAASSPSANRLARALEIMSEIASTDSGYCALLHAADEWSLPDMEDEFRIYGERVVDKVAELFGIYTGYTCSVCIKVCNYSPDVPSVGTFSSRQGFGARPFVYTFWRDARSRLQRQAVDTTPELAVYPLETNTGLLEASQTGYWFHNDLQSLGNSYKSKNPNWSSYYNATCVVAIAPPTESGPINPNGFLCVDNVEGGFDNESCRPIMCILANFLQYSMWMTAEIAYKKGQDDDKSL